MATIRATSSRLFYQGSTERKVCKFSFFTCNFTGSCSVNFIEFVFARSIEFGWFHNSKLFRNLVLRFLFFESEFAALNIIVWTYQQVSVTHIFILAIFRHLKSVLFGLEMLCKEQLELLYQLLKLYFRQLRTI